MDNSLLDVRDINHKYIVVEWNLAVIDDSNAGKVTMNLVLRMASIIDDAYPVINKAIWS